MRIPVSTLISACLLQFSTSLAQTTEKVLLKFGNIEFSMGVNKHEQLIVTTRDGEVAIPDSIKGCWRKSYVNRNAAGYVQNNAYLDHVCFFNPDTAIIAGSISDNKWKHHFIYHTINGGKSWKQIDFGMAGWVNEVAYLDNGEAWLGVSGKGVAYTKDYGFNWSQFPFPKKEGTWFNKIHFNTNREGIIGAQSNALAYTPDNCKTWKFIPTPLDQKKYNKTDIAHEPRINSVAIFSNYLLVSQEHQVFYSKKDNVNWVFMPGYTGFYTDAENSALFLGTADGGFVKCDNHLQPVSSVEGIGRSYKTICRNGSLYMLGDDKLGQINARNKLIVSPIYTNVPVEKVEPKETNETDHGYWGFIKQKIYLKTERYGKWEYICTVPFSVDSGVLSMKDAGTVAFSRNDDSVFYYNIADGKVERRAQKEMLEGFCSKGIKSILFVKGGSGCFGEQSSDTMVYDLKEDRFVLSRKHFTGGATRDLADNGNEIDKQLVDEFVKKIPSLYKKKVSIDDLEFTQLHYDTCKQNIQAFKTLQESQIRNRETEERKGAFTFYINNLNFSRLKKVVDSVKDVEPGFLESYFEIFDYPGYNRWAQVIFINRNNEMLEIRSRWYTKPRLFYFPWVITLNGVSSTNRAIEINRFVRAVFPKFLEGINRVELIQNLVKELYSKYSSLPRE